MRLQVLTEATTYMSMGHDPFTESAVTLLKLDLPKFVVSIYLVCLSVEIPR